MTSELAAAVDEAPAPPRRLRDRGLFAYGYLGVVHGIALSAIALHPTAWELLVALGMYVWMGLGLAIYLHRSLAHRSLVLAPPLAAFFALGTAIGLMRNPIWWAGLHRLHHQRADRAGDVHSPREGMFHAHVGWIARADDFTLDAVRATRDLQQTWYTRLFGDVRCQLGLHAFIATAYLLFAGPAGAVWCLFVPVVVFMNGVWAVNSLGHRFGYRSFETPDTSVNNRVLGLLTLGEGFHNNHHARPQRARAGLFWHEPDVAAWAIALFERLGLAHDVRWLP